MIRLSGSLAVLDEVNFRFIPDIRAQKDFLLEADFSERPASSLLTGALRFPPVASL